MREKVVEGIVDRTLQRMSTEERQDLILKTVDKLLLRMEAPERLSLMRHVIDQFLEGLDLEERKTTVRELVPSLMAQLMKSGDMSVDELLWAAMGSLGALEKGTETR